MGAKYLSEFVSETSRGQRKGKPGRQNCIGSGKAGWGETRGAEQGTGELWRYPPFPGQLLLLLRHRDTMEIGIKWSNRINSTGPFSWWASCNQQWKRVGAPGSRAVPLCSTGRILWAFTSHTHNPSHTLLTRFHTVITFKIIGKKTVPKRKRYKTILYFIRKPLTTDKKERKIIIQTNLLIYSYTIIE